ncbi:MAG TPA: acyl-CoA dehydrogenase family protein [Thermoanaerobaculia bacterium]|nr:acyl-CoA dehydrogenase family protein [Thermoanaerobaculia bacterium]HQP87832.1 acyl-CoA dehydrogenase family protein [Thermoanaerobaculia bacterium]
MSTVKTDKTDKTVKAETEAPSFLKALYQGRFDESLVFPYPEIPEDTKELVTAFADAYRDFDAANIDSEKIDADHFFPRDVVKGLGELGAMGMAIPEEYGGSEFSAAAYCKMMEVIGPLDASAAIVIGAHQSIGIKPLLLFGTEEQKRKWLPDLAVAKMVGAFCLTEPEAGSDAASLKTTAVYDPATDEYVLTGTKQWISNGGFARFFTVFARVPEAGVEAGSHKEIACFAVVANEDGTLSGLSRGVEEKKLGLCGSSTCQIILDGCRVPAFNLIGGKGNGFRVAVETLNTGRTSLGAGAVGGCKQMIKLAVEHATQRKQFKTRIADFEMIREKISEMTAHTYVLESMVYMTAGLVDKKVDYSLEGACCKVWGTELLWKTINESLQIAGGNGFMNEYPYGRGLRDSRINMIFEGTNEILRLFIALTGMKEAGDVLKDFQGALSHPVSQYGVLVDHAKMWMRGTVTSYKLDKVHPSLAPEADQVGKYAAVLRNACETMVYRNRKNVVNRQYLLHRIADVVMDLYAQIATLSRVTAAIEKKGEEKAKPEIEIVRWFSFQARHRMVANLKALDKHKDAEATAISNVVYEAGGYPFDLWGW